METTMKTQQTEIDRLTETVEKLTKEISTIKYVNTISPNVFSDLQVEEKEMCLLGYMQKLSEQKILSRY